MNARDLIVGEQAPDLSLMTGPAPVFSTEQEARIREIVGERGAVSRNDSKAIAETVGAMAAQASCRPLGRIAQTAPEPRQPFDSGPATQPVEFR